MFRVTYSDFWECLYRVYMKRGTQTYLSVKRQLFAISAFDNRGVLIPDEYRVKK